MRCTQTVLLRKLGFPTYGKKPPPISGGGVYVQRTYKIVEPAGFEPASTAVPMNGFRRDVLPARTCETSAPTGQ